MIDIDMTEVYGWEAAIRGMRNPMNSWDKSDSVICTAQDGCDNCPEYYEADCAGNKHDGVKIGNNDHDLMMRLAKGGSVHAKYRRMITVTCDITAPLYWWKEFDTYKVGTVANSCSTMHKIHAKEFTLDDFSHEKLICGEPIPGRIYSPFEMLEATVHNLNICREMFLTTKDKRWWEQMIQLLPSSYNQKRTVLMNYEVLAGIYPSRKDHKLDEWRKFCEWIKELPYSEIITGVLE